MNNTNASRAPAGASLAVFLLVLAAVGGLWYSRGAGDLDVRTREVAPGVWYHQVRMVKGPWRIHVLEIDLSAARRAGVRLRTAGAPDGVALKTSQLAAQAVAGINGDFFDEDRGRVRVLGLEIRDGCLLRPPGLRSALAITRAGVPLIARFKLEGGMVTTDGIVRTIARFGREPAPDGLSLYAACTPHLSDSVHAALGLQLEPLAPVQGVNDTLLARVQQVRRRHWPLLLEPGQWLVAVGGEHSAGEHVAPGDTVRLIVRVVPEDEPRAREARYMEAIGGGPRILRDGVVRVEYEQERLARAFAEERHPRTAVGYTRDRRVLYLVVVDGRQPGYSVGMRLDELAEFLGRHAADFARCRANAYQALNLDGGGSSTMVIGGEVVNSPSAQTGERPVANALVLVHEEMAP